MVTAWRTHRLELDDQTLREWDAAVLNAGADGIVLDRSAFYPGGGGQPPDHGVLLWGGVQTRIEGARKGDDLYLIPAEGDPVPPPGTTVRGAVEDARRTALMRTHSGLHVLCGVVFRDYGSLVTGGNMEPYTARMDFDLPEVPDGFKDAVVGRLPAASGVERRAVEHDPLGSRREHGGVPLPQGLVVKLEPVGAPGGHHGPYGPMCVPLLPRSRKPFTFGRTSVR